MAFQTLAGRVPQRVPPQAVSVAPAQAGEALPAAKRLCLFPPCPFQSFYARPTFAQVFVQEQVALRKASTLPLPSGAIALGSVPRSGISVLRAIFGRLVCTPQRPPG